MTTNHRKPKSLSLLLGQCLLLEREIENIGPSYGVVNQGPQILVPLLKNADVQVELWSSKTMIIMVIILFVVDSTLKLFFSLCQKNHL